MRFSTSKANLKNLSSDMLVVALTSEDLLQKRKKPGTHSIVKTLEDRFGASLIGTLSKAQFKGEAGESFSMHLADPQIGSLLLFVMGEQESSSVDAIHEYRRLGAHVRSTAKRFGAERVALLPNNLRLEKESHLTAFVEGVLLSGYEYTQYRSSKKESPSLVEVSLLSGRQLPTEVIDRARVMCEATLFARDLINMPANDCSPSFMVEAARQTATKGKLKFQVYDSGQLKKMGAGLLLAVGQGSDSPPALVKLTYVPPKASSKTKVISLVGKGITYDTGGYSLKPGDSMIGMKGDMSGAAAVLGTMMALSKLTPRCEVRAYLPIAENMISGRATRVGDIVTSLSGKTVEILNTDAEGRLILADALALATRERANVIVDVATLTGACVVALGLEYAGLFASSERLATDLTRCGELEGERFWRLPLAREYRESLTNGIADVKNIAGNRWGGAIIGALFLQEFVAEAIAQGTQWAHLDIAGPADTDKSADHLSRGGVGFGVRTLTRYVLSQR